jgi:hypothetical protein
MACSSRADGLVNWLLKNRYYVNQVTFHFLYQVRVTTGTSKDVDPRGVSWKQFEEIQPELWEAARPAKTGPSAQIRERLRSSNGRTTRWRQGMGLV